MTQSFRITGRNVPKGGRKTVTRNFLTRDAADAFIEGLEYVNDSTITDIQLIVKPHGDFTVRFIDGDKTVI